MPAVTIDLDAAARTAAGTLTTIRRDAFSTILAKLVSGPIDPIESDDPRSDRPLALDVMPHRRHDALLVSARRGDGKTTFLTDVLALLQRCGPDDPEFRSYLPASALAAKPHTLYSLGIVDPTLIESKQNIVVIIVEKIRAAVDRARDVRGDRRRDAGRRGFEPRGDDGAYDDFRRRLHDLAAGLTLLDGIGHDTLFGKDWADPDYVLEKGLDGARAAGGFERAFRRFVEAACDLVGRDAFVLAIDDVDTWFERGWLVLEALRKYLATPRLKVILAGDLKLYNLLVRQRQWQQITAEFLDAERKLPAAWSHLDQIVGMVDTLQDQYLVKVARPENRVDLRPLLYYADRGEGVAFVRGAISVDERTASRAFGRGLLALRRRADQDAVRSTLLRLPVRSVVQVMAGAWSLTTPGTDGPEARTSALDALGHVVSTRLMAFDLDERELREAEPERVFGVLAQWMGGKGLWASMPRFHPEGGDDGRDLVAIFISANLVDMFRRRPKGAFDYWLRICTIREKVDRDDVTIAARMADEVPSGGGAMDARDGRRTPVARDLGSLLHHVRATNQEGTTQFVGRLAAWEAGSGAGQQLDRQIRTSGVSVPSKTLIKEPRSVIQELYGADFDFAAFAAVANGGGGDHEASSIGLAPALRGYHQALVDAGWAYPVRPAGSTSSVGLLPNFANTIESLARDLDADAALLVSIPALKVTSGQGSENTLFSILRLLSFVGETLAAARSPSHGERQAMVRDLLTRLPQLRSYPAPGFTEGGPEDGIAQAGRSGSAKDAGTKPDPAAEDEEQEDEAEAATDAEQAPAGELEAALCRWVAGLEHLEPVSPITLARAWTRFSYAFDGVQGALAHLRTRYLGVLTHRAIIAFLHAVGVEALRAADRELPRKVLNNPIESSENFLILIERVLSQSDGWRSPDPDVEFFLTIFSCPLWGYFLARKESDVDDRAKMAHRSPTMAVYARYRECMDARGGLSPSYRVRLTNNRSSKAVDFDGLFFVLNTVQIQGQRPGRRGRGGGSIIPREVNPSKSDEPSDVAGPHDARNAAARRRTQSGPPPGRARLPPRPGVGSEEDGS